jgi:hypothetical protein
MERIQPIGRPDDGPAPIPAVRRLTPKEREDAARERQRRRRARGPAAAAPPDDDRPEGSVSIDIRA